MDDLTRTVVVVGFVVVAVLLYNIFRLLERIEQLLRKRPHDHERPTTTMDMRS